MLQGTQKCFDGGAELKFYGNLKKAGVHRWHRDMRRDSRVVQSSTWRGLVGSKTAQRGAQKEAEMCVEGQKAGHRGAQRGMEWHEEWSGGAWSNTESCIEGTEF